MGGEPGRSDLCSAYFTRLLGIHAHEVPAAKPAPAPKVSFRVLFEKPYRERTIVAGVMNICISFEYTAIAFSCRQFLPSSSGLASSKLFRHRWG